MSNNAFRAFLFIGYIPTNQSLYKNLQQAGFILVFKSVLETKVSKKVVVKGNVDAELVLHAMIEFENYDKAVIVSGDGDFYCLIVFLEKKQKLLKIIAPGTKFSSLLRKFSSFIVNISLIKKKLEYKKR